MSRNTDPDAAGKVASIYLDNDSGAKLDELTKATGLSRSLVVRNLIQNESRKTKTGNKLKMRKLVGQLTELIDQT